MLKSQAFEALNVMRLMNKDATGKNPDRYWLPRGGCLIPSRGERRKKSAVGGAVGLRLPGMHRTSQRNLIVCLRRATLLY